MRVFLAGLFGGLMIFFAGFFSHQILGWGGRTIQTPKDLDKARDSLVAELKEPGIHSLVPQNRPEFATLPIDKQIAEMQKTTAQFIQGPNGYVIIAPPIDATNGPKQILLEALSNIISALIVAWIMTQIAPISFLRRWMIVLAFGFVGWLSISASQYLWYYFPAAFIRDELFCALLEWGIAGLLIASIVRPRIATK